MSKLLHNTHYFARYGEHLSSTEDCRAAWEAVEKDFFRETGGFRRFTTYESFASAHSNFKAGKYTRNITLKCVVHFINDY